MDAASRYFQLLTPARCRALLALVLGVGFVSRILYLTVYPPIGLSGDEAHYWDWSRQLDWSYYSKGPGVAWVIRFGCTLFGDTMFGVRFPALLLAIGISLCTYWLTLRIFKSDRIALGAVLLCHVVPMFIAGSMLMTIDPPYYFGWAMATCLAHVAIFSGRKWAWPAAGVFVGFSILAKYAALMWLACLLIFLITSKPHRRWLKTIWPWVTIVVALAFMTPVIIWNQQHDWVTFGHVARSTTENQSHFNPLKILGNLGLMVGSQIGILNPIIAGFMVAGVWCALRERQGATSSNASPQWGEGRVGPTSGETHATAADIGDSGGVTLETPPATPAPQGRGTGERSSLEAERAGRVFLLSFSIPFFLLVAIVTLFKEIEPNWPAATYFTLVPLAAWFVATHYARVRGWLAVAIGIGLVTIPLIHYTTLLYPLAPVEPRKWDPAFRLQGGQQIGDAVSNELKTMRDGTFVLCDKYQTAGLMAFYVAGHPKTYYIGSYILDPEERDRLSQYDMWPDRSLDQPALRGRDAIFVGHQQPDLYAAFDRVERLPDLPIVSNGVVIRRQKLFRCYNFHGMTRPNDGKTKR
jgi:4-amino-4-deoxy-L-arabinose transferase-like glycosyltransferase